MALQEKVSVKLKNVLYTQNIVQNNDSQSLLLTNSCLEPNSFVTQEVPVYRHVTANAQYTNANHV